MKKEELEKGLKLREDAHAWWRKTIPSFEHPNYQDEPIPQFMKWFNEHAAPELRELSENPDWPLMAKQELEAVELREKGKKARARKIVNRIALDDRPFTEAEQRPARPPKKK